MKTLGEIAYEAYCKSRKWITVAGDPFPCFGALKDLEQAEAEAWEAAAKAVAEEISNQTGRG